MNTQLLSDEFHNEMVDHIFDHTILWNSPRCDFIAVYCAGWEL